MEDVELRLNLQVYIIEGWRWVGLMGKSLQDGFFLVYSVIFWIDFVYCQIEFIIDFLSWIYLKIIKIRFLGYFIDVFKGLDNIL